ncbi:Sterile alpha motif pointed and Ets domain containing protein, protein [Aphelenchoides besseyi]|nr:Sterile alpha motif pointed and Ets domain containing protein, protein [Aphelenchoides besseyi]
MQVACDMDVKQRNDICDWASASSPSLSEPDDNDLDVGFGETINLGVKQEEHILSTLNQNSTCYERSQYNNVVPSVHVDYQRSITQQQMQIDGNPDAQMDIYRELILRHLIQDIATTCSKLGLPTNPALWNVDQTMSWILEMCPQFHLLLPPNLGLNGQMMLEMSAEELRAIIPNGGDTIHAQFQLWKTAFESQNNQHKMQQTIERPSYPLSSTVNHVPKNNTSGLRNDVLEFDNSFAHGSAAIPSHMPQPNGYYQEVQPLHQHQQFGYSPKSSFVSHHQSHVGHQTFANNNCAKNYFDGHHPPTMPSPSESDISSRSSSCVNDDEYTDHRFMSFSQQPDAHMVYGNMSSSYSSVLYDDCEMNASMHQSMGMQQLNGYCDQNLGIDNRVPHGITRNSGSIHLWHFIRELLDKPNEYQTCVRWVDRKEGTFKIESSHHLARFWGLRKNRSQMNYDKLSRSLRQYYKKGIIQKPEKKQRLVYKFLPPYNN